MTSEEAQALASLIASTWPAAKIAAHIWVTPLERLNSRQATVTYDWFRDKSQRAPTVAGFIAKNRELHAVAETAPTRTPCVSCHGVGWIEVTVNRPETGFPPSTGVAPCRCPNGHQYEPGWRRALDENRLAVRGEGRPITQGGGQPAYEW